MNKCEHGEKITLFCASECCVWKQAAGCEACIKKYHNHMGTTVFLSEEEISALVKKYTMDSSIKPKCRILQEAIYAYFNLVKNELSASLDAACKNIINQIGYPYLYTNNTLSTYKRLKNKEYKKLIQKDFRALYELSQKINQKDLARQQAKIYVKEMRLTEDLINTLEDLVKKYENNIKKYHPAFAHDGTHVMKINQIFHTLSEGSPRSSHTKSKEEKKQMSPVYQFKDRVEKSDSIKLEPISIISSPPSTVHERSPTLMSSPTSRPNKNREVSLDKKLVREHKFSGGQPASPMVNKQSAKEVGANQKSERMQVVRQQLSNKEQQINQKKKMLMEMMKSKEEKPLQKDQKDDKGISESRERVFDRPKVLDLKGLANRESSLRTTTLETPVSRAENMSRTSEKAGSQNESSSREECDQDESKMQVNNHAFTQLPVQEKIPKLRDELDLVKQKVIVVATNHENNLEMHSPLYKLKNILDKYKDISNMTESGIHRILKGQQKSPIEDNNSPILDLIPIYHKKTDTVLELKQNQEQSLALLLKSLNLKAQEAIVYLQKALVCAENNLSAAEYLSFLYLQLQKPAECLKLCNRMLDRLENSSEPEQLSLIINNNKASALNVLGRYSESIVLLERCLRYREKDYFFKNLGDAYFSISIYQKAIYNYQKALVLNDHHDEAHYNLAVCLYIQENYQHAKLSIQKALEVNSANENYHELKTNIETRISNF